MSLLCVRVSAELNGIDSEKSQERKTGTWSLIFSVIFFGQNILHYGGHSFLIPKTTVTVKIIAFSHVSSP